MFTGLNYINYIDNQINEYKKIFQVELIRYWNYLFQIINVLQRIVERAFEKKKHHLRKRKKFRQRI